MRSDFSYWVDAQNHRGFRCAQIFLSTIVLYIRVLASKEELNSLTDFRGRRVSDGNPSRFRRMFY